MFHRFRFGRLELSLERVEAAALNRPFHSYLKAS